MAQDHKCTLLIVDDDPFISDLLVRKFIDAGFETRHASNGEEAMKKLEGGYIPDSMLLDLMMPIMDGYEVLRQLKKNPKFAAIPVVVLSNAGSEADVVKAKELGAIDCLLKIEEPLDSVVSKIRAVCPQNV